MLSSPYDKLEASLDKLDEYLQSLEAYVFSSVSAATHGLPDVQEAVNRLWVDISRYGPGLPAFPDIGIPALGDFQVPPPPPPHPSRLAKGSSSTLGLGGWVKSHPKTVGVVGVGLVGAGLYFGYRAVNQRQRGGRGPRAAGLAASRKGEAGERKQVVVVLGGDTPYGLPVVQGLEKKGYIVIASVATADAVDVLESKCKGYVKALVLDPSEPATVPIFLRSLSSTLSRKFPLRSAGDPYSSPSSQPYVQSVISLLTLPSSYSASSTPPLGPVEHLSLSNDYLPYLTATQITPLRVIQQLLPVLRTGSARSKDKGPKTILVCLPAVDTRVSLPFSAVQGMSAAGTLKGIETLRREIRMAASTGGGEGMDGIKVVIVDVGAVELPGSVDRVVEERTEAVVEGLKKATDTWTASEKLIYGPAFASVLQSQAGPQSLAASSISPQMSIWDAFKGLFDENRRYTVSRKPVKLNVFVDRIVAAVSGGRGCGPLFLGYDIGIGYVRTWLRGDQFAVGAGALTYRVASYLPSLLLDTLLNLPYYLIGIRNRLLPAQPFRQPPSDLPRAQGRRRGRGSPSYSPSSSTASRRDVRQIRAIEASREELVVDPLTSAEVEPLDVAEYAEDQAEAEEAGSSTVDDSELGSDPSELDSDVGSSWISLQGHEGDLKTPSA
ncbi:hypothetical protein BKA70DRAFT_1175886 [Coprinopsis sp. MPI-PUGE-AT-0042]|nr:hypothetical protein BKA70DRAFT_1175886 [Coprinopsis sp. MPI-PUGE-AT-0042]